MISLILSFITLILFLIMSMIFYYKSCYYTIPSTYKKPRIAILSNKDISVKNTMYVDYKVFTKDDIYLSLNYIKNNNFDLIIGCDTFSEYSIIKANINNIPLICTGPTITSTAEPTLMNDVFMCLDMENIITKIFYYYSNIYKISIEELIANTYLVNNIQNNYIVAFLIASIKSLTSQINISNYIKTNISYNLNNVPSNALLVLYASNGVDLKPSNKKSEREIPLIFLNYNETKYTRYSTDKLLLESYTIQQLTNKRFENNYTQQYIQSIQTPDAAFSYTMPLEYTEFNVLLAIEYMNKYTASTQIIDYIQQLQNINDTMYYYRVSENMFGQPIVGENPIYDLTNMKEMEYIIIKVNKITSVLTDRLGKLLCVPERFVELIIPKNKFVVIE